MVHGWVESSDDFGRAHGVRSWTATIVRAVPWDPGDTHEHVLHVSYDRDDGGEFVWGTTLAEWAGATVDGYGRVSTLRAAQGAAEAHFAGQGDRVGVAPVSTPRRRVRWSDAP